MGTLVEECETDEILRNPFNASLQISTFRPSSNKRWDRGEQRVEGGRNKGTDNEEKEENIPSSFANCSSSRLSKA
jgi:hypothetical protein